MLQITINGSDISSHLVTYTREKDLCSSEGIIEFELDSYSNINPYAVIRAYEDTNLKGTFYTDFTEKMSDGTMSVHGRDNSKRASDYYIAEQFTAEGDTTSRYWIEFFLGMAGISYNFTTTDLGYTIQEGEVMGLTSCAEVVEMLVRYSAWYIYYNASNVAQIGKLDYDSSSYQKAFTDDDIISINYIKNDQYLRNRAVVWGAGYTGEQEWVFADISVTTPWEYDSLDKRAILARAGFPVPFSQAIATANVLLNEYARLVEEKTIAVHGFHDLEIGDFVLIQSQYYNGICLISAINVSTTDSGGYVTNLILDRRCPRFVGFYDVGGIVYTGTDGDGIWTKPLKTTHTWTDYSAGLSDLYIKDLDVSYGVMSTVTATGYLYGRTVGDAAWIRLQPSYFYDTIGSGYYPASSGIYVASTVKDLDQSLYGVFTVSGSDPRTWITRYPAVGGTPTNIFVTLSGEVKYEGIDIEASYEDLYVSVVERGGISYGPPAKSIYPFAKGDGITFSTGSELDDIAYQATSELSYMLPAVTEHYIYRYDGTNKRIYRYNLYASFSEQYIQFPTSSMNYIYYVPIDDDTGLLVAYYLTTIYIFKLDFGTLSYSTEKTFERDAQYTALNSIFGVVDTGTTKKIILRASNTTSPNRRLGFYIIDCTTFDVSLKNFEFGSASLPSAGLSVTAGETYNYTQFADMGDGTFGLYGYTSSGNTDVFFIIDTNNLDNSITVNFLNVGQSANEVRVAADRTKNCYFIQFTNEVSQIFDIYKVTASGDKSVIKSYAWRNTEKLDTFALPYNDNKVISVHTNGVETIFYDCSANRQLFSYPRVDNEHYSNGLGKNNEVFVYSSAAPITASYTTLFNGIWSSYVTMVDTVENWGTYGIDPVKTGLQLTARLYLAESDITQGESHEEQLDSASMYAVNFYAHVDEPAIYRITADGYYIRDTSTDPDTYANKWNMWVCGETMALPSDNYSYIGDGVGKEGLGIDGMYASSFTWAGGYSEQFFSWLPGNRSLLMTNDGDNGILYIAARPDDPGNPAQESSWAQGLSTSDRDTLRGDNSGSLTATITKCTVDTGGNELELYFEFPSPMITSTSSNTLIVTVHHEALPDFRQLYVKINGTKYYGFDGTYNGALIVLKDHTFEKELPVDFEINTLSVGTDLFPYGFTDYAEGTEFTVDITVTSIGLNPVPYTRNVLEKITIEGVRSVFKASSYVSPTVTYSVRKIEIIKNMVFYVISYYNNYRRIYHTKPFVDLGGSGNVGRILRYRNNEFENVFSLADAHFNLDISSPSVITAYTGVSTSGTIFISGEPYSTGSSRGDIFFSFAGDNFRHINLSTMSGSYIYDSRGFNLVDLSGEFRTCIGFVALSGMFGGVGQFSYVDVTEYEDLGSVIVFPDIHTVESFNYVPVALETSNYNHYTTPYFLVGLSGTSTPFLQRDIDTETFINRSDNFPASKITTIRLDDMI